MSWVRIDENIIDHPKFIALTPLAFWLWVEGLTYCQKHLTDGLIPHPVLVGMRHYSPAAMKRLIASPVPGKGPLWHETPSGDVEVHDYLEHNDSRELVLSKRSAARDRMRGKRSREHGSEHPREHPANVRRTATANTHRGGECSEEKTFKEGEGGVGETPLTVRAGAFCEWYEDNHRRFVGVGYMGTNSDYMKAQELCKRFTDQELHDAAIVWFGMDDDFTRSGTRSIPKFASRASHCVQIAKQVSA